MLHVFGPHAHDRWGVDNYSSGTYRWMNEIVSSRPIPGGMEYVLATDVELDPPDYAPKEIYGDHVSDADTQDIGQGYQLAFEQGPMLATTKYCLA
ncbi:hypothetical protein [Jatrophihabitans sp.]|uniref:hypothetical protein n=1 Tax=Jatrophihabitans sp. TaxID=1932789 RepID=UPI003F7E0C13